MPTSKISTVDQADIAQFERLGNAWWDEGGPMRALHQINPVRIGYIRDLAVEHFAKGRTSGPRLNAPPLSGLSILDIGCGAGILSEPLTRLGGLVTGIDPAPGNISAAREHASNVGLEIDYRAATAERLAGTGAKYDVVLAMEVVEHVVSMPAFVTAACGLVRPGGLLIASTLNRTLKSFALAIVGAEYVLGWLPKGTHHWEKFVTPEELETAICRGGLHVIDQTGMVYNPVTRAWSLQRDTGVNYLMAASRNPAPPRTQAASPRKT